MILSQDELERVRGAVPVCGGADFHLLLPGASGLVLTTDPTQPLGVKWASGAGGGSGTVTSIVAGAGLTGGTITSTGTIALATTGLALDQTQSAITADTDGATITCALNLTNWHTVTLGGNRTLAVSGGVTGQQFTIVLVQDGSGSRTVTWFSGIKWAGGSAPTLTTTINKADIFTFKQTGAGAYYGMIAGQNF